MPLAFICNDGLDLYMKNNHKKPGKTAFGNNAATTVAGNDGIPKILAPILKRERHIRAASCLAPRGNQLLGSRRPAPAQDSHYNNQRR